MANFQKNVKICKIRMEDKYNLYSIYDRAGRHANVYT